MSLQNSHQIENVKMMLVKGIDGRGITSIEKTSTSGLVDTYTITYTDGTKDTFTVTNGKGISSIEKTGTSGLIDTYTITFNDGTTGTFTVTNGKSIVSIEKTGTVGLTDTYTITYNDGSTDTFEVVNGGYDVGDQNTAVGNPLSFTTDSAQVSQGTVITLEPIQSGSGDPSPSNVRAISGYDEIRLGVPRVNQWDEEWEVGALNSSGQKTSGANRTRTKNYIPFIGGKSYYIKGPSSLSIWVCYYDADKKFISGETKSLNAVYEAPTNCCFMMFNTGTDYGGTYNHDISINYPSTDTSYHAYNPITDISIQLDSTIYGGTLDVESGELTVTHAKVDMGDLNWAVYQTTYFRSATSLTYHKKKGRYNLLCDMFKTDDGTSPMPDNTIWGSTSDGDYFFLKATSYADATALISAVTGHYIVYELAEPIVYHLTPHQVKLLQGANVVTSNGTSISLKWREGQVMTLDDANGLADSIEALGEQGTKIKTVEFASGSAQDVASLFTFLGTLTMEQISTSKLYFSSQGMWLYPNYSKNGGWYYVSVPRFGFTTVEGVVHARMIDSIQVDSFINKQIRIMIDITDTTNTDYTSQQQLNSPMTLYYSE